MRGWATGRGQEKNGEKIKYCAVKFSHPNSVRLPIQYPHRTRKLSLVRPPAWQNRSSNHKLSDSSSSSGEFCSSRISFSPNAQRFLSLSPVFVPIRHPK